MEQAAQSPLADSDLHIAAALAPAATSPPTAYSSRRPAPRADPKLRDSCHACSSSKVKCHKEKPTCSRCSKRGITCEYFATRRGGRTNHERRSTVSSSDAGSRTIMVKQNIPSLSGWFGSNSNPPADLAVAPMVLIPSPGPTPGISSANFLSDVCPVDPALNSLPRGLTDLDTTDIDKFLASPTSLFDTDFLNHSDFFSGIDSASTSSNGQINATTLLDTFCFMDRSLSAPIATPRSPPSSLTSPMYMGSSGDHASSHKEDRPPPSLPDSSSSGRCLVKALGLMKELFPNSTTACTASSPKHDSLGSDSTALPPNIQTVITQNRETVEAIGSILQCACSRDGYLLSVMALIVFKVLRWYAAAAAKTQTAATVVEKVVQTPTKVGSYCLEGEHSAHMAAKLVLSELHRVQRLINMLSERLKVYSPTASEASAMASNSEPEAGMVPPFSAAVLDQLAIDLKKQLKALSRDIVEGLRKEC